MIKHIFIISLALQLCLSCNTSVNDQSLDNSDKYDGIKLGAAVNPDYLSESDYSSALSNKYNTIVVENDMKFGYLQPTEGGFDFTKADSAISFATTNDMFIRGHVLLWHNDHQIPNWLSSKSYSQLESAIEDHIEVVLNHYKHKIYAWDVANEIIKDDGSGFRNRNDSNNYSIWSNSSTDDSVIKAAFYKADEVRDSLDDDVKLFLCDYSNETMGHSKADKFYEVVNSWVEQGVPIDGVGFQMHLDGRNEPDYYNIRRNIDRFQSLGLEVQFTEVDIRLYVTDGVTDNELELQADIYGNLMDIVLEKEMDTFVTWGVSDKYSWIPDFFSGMGDALLLDDSYEEKIAYTKILDKI